MTRYSAGFSKTTGAAAGIICELRTGTAKDIRLLELQVSLETAVAATIGLVRATSAGTTPAGDQVAVAEDYSNTRTVASHIYTTYTTEPTQAAVYLRRQVLPATIGSGLLWVWPNGLTIPTTTDSAGASGLLLRQLSTAAVTYSVYAVFEE